MCRKGFSVTVLLIFSMKMLSCYPKLHEGTCPDMQEGYLLPGCHSGGAKNIALIYISDFGGHVMEWTEDEFLPYVTYIDDNNQTHSELMLFDTYLFLAGARNVNGELHSFSNKYETGAPSDIDDWNWLLRKLFDEENYGLNALDNIAGRLKRNLKVIIVKPYPDREQHSAGILNGKNLDFGDFHDRELAVVSWIDTVIQNGRKSPIQTLN